jgi:AcrR family transcriptional regulator
MVTASKNAYQDLFEAGLSKSERTRIVIARAAITNYATVGVEQTNFDRIAKSAGVTRPLVQHYFGTREALFTFVVKYIRADADAFLKSRMKTAKGHGAPLKWAIEAFLDWAKENPAHVKVWLLFQYQASVDADLRELCSETANLIHQAIVGLLVTGGHGDFASLVTSAKMVQHFLTGAIVSRVTEDRPAPEPEFRKELIRKCLELADL